MASTGAAFPVTTLTGPRARFCLSASHDDQMIDYAVKCLDEIGTEIGLKFDEHKIAKRLKQQQQNAQPAPVTNTNNTTTIPAAAASSITTSTAINNNHQNNNHHLVHRNLNHNHTIINNHQINHNQMIKV